MIRAFKNSLEYTLLFFSFFYYYNILHYLYLGKFVIFIKKKKKKEMQCMTNTRDRYCKQTLIGHWNLGEPHLGKVFGMT